MSIYQIVDRESHRTVTAHDHDLRESLFDLVPVDDDTPSDVAAVTEQLVDAVARGDWQRVHYASEYLALDVYVLSDVATLHVDVERTAR